MVQLAITAYADAQIEALKKALFIASLFVLVGAWVAHRLPNDPLPPEPA